MKIEGNTNDYFGKGLSGATLIVKVPNESTFKSNENVITGNVALYGATSGEAYINGIAGERFCVRNSGATAVVEGVGDHGCEYMTGGIALILGKIGRNFAAGMSGGIAYIYKSDKNYSIDNFNMEMVEFEKLDSQDFDIIKELLEKHYSYTHSGIAEEIILNWNKSKNMFVKIMPTEYKMALEKMAQSKINEIIN
jgi:glutamate synthase (ferredoxin)